MYHQHKYYSCRIKHAHTYSCHEPITIQLIDTNTIRKKRHYKMSDF